MKTLLMTKVCGRRAALLLLLATCSELDAQVWDVGADFSGVNNPNGAWSYGRKWTSLDPVFDAFTVGDDWGTGTPYYWWFGNLGHGGPALSGTPGGAGTQVNAWAKDNSNGLPTARWTSPETGVYDLDGQFVGTDSRGVDSLVFVVVNGSIAFSDHLVGYGDTAPFSLRNISVPQGQNVDFVVQWNGGVYSEYSWTALSGTVQSVPEPSSCLFATLLVGMSVRRISRRA